MAKGRKKSHKKSTSSKKSGSKSHVREPVQQQPSSRGNVGYMWPITAVFMTIVFMIVVFAGSADQECPATGKVVMEKQNELLFINSTTCNEPCKEMRTVAKDAAKTAGLEFREVTTKKQIPIPGYMVIEDGEAKNFLQGIQDEGTFLNQMCDISGNEKLCKQAEESNKAYVQQNMKVLGNDTEKPRLDYFVMAFCPYGNPADKSASQLHDLFGDKVKIVPHYILSVSGDSVSSMHGSQEANQGVREMCALQELGMDAYYDFTLAVNDKCSSQNADSCWEGAAKDAGVSVDEIKQCMDDDKLSLAKDEAELIDKLRTKSRRGLVPPKASPTFLINGETYSGSRDTESLKQAICEEFENPPAECDKKIGNSGGSQPSGQC